MIGDIIAGVSQFALDVISATGYWGIFILSALESAAIPIPSEVVVPFSGFLAATGRFNWVAVAIVATVANLVGSVILFLIGKSGGRWILEKYGKYVLINRRDLDSGDRWFLKHGVKAVFWSRMLPVVRTFASLPAGIAKMNFSKFATYTVAGSLPWNAALAYVGFKMGENWSALHEYFENAKFVIVGIILAALIFYVIKHKRKSNG